MNVKRLCVSACMLALATGLSMVCVYRLPLGGSITLFSMVPLCVLSVCYGVGYSLIPCILYGIIQFTISGAIGWGLTPAVLAGCIFLDYLGAFGALAFSGAFAKKGVWGVAIGTALSAALRFAFHFLSGLICFTNFEPFEMLGRAFGGNPALYSLLYNGSFMLPELILTVVGMTVITKTGILKMLAEGKK